ncbi:DUF3429 domain-containing protein [Actimicrobium sp. CCC2.4]|uniref:DUF3429 domain-containing protein n=1 Tax=Actimicrobium sp. CCC2.4 TaxID=3048606 RepID=UPI002AC9A2A3|nr:DUF3429 domain-containing protein [Actimicrobium sp. CCC2.4]MEB0135544.1 DUF3429 domain-containing protein [Actimicrobium sp. CCC2.4]WPX32288.1 DUF3429 domain-containing protein [Actimicrobium sp. CCC2.4]
MNINFFNQRLAFRLGMAGLIPFVLLSLGCWLVHPDWLGYLVKAQLAYGIAILSFLGGIHWGAALTCNLLTIAQTKRSLIWGVTPSLIALLASRIEIGLGFAVLMAGFIAAYQIDKRLYQWYGIPDWFIGLRFKLTCVVVTALVVTFLAANVRS